ncbi:asparagine synthase (glutamine-hydrolyzing) [Trichlorobacter lovleyi]|uniref:asparagine synthase (glutamine-hydrolyzing) n=1 Tax=Trichlorobacter lovleyi TaxID=313985 RepID=UPI00223FC9F7|nr:asparagine synthase (glutamine-hydrolyzing) [Trichlorobacter lovleyi]QOX80360.1 asparagine synthase (glutamine-hydrolyzing) [Trichlorobacter lovleyi]
MCGICGFTGAPNQLALHAMVSSIIHRGPDDEGVFSNDQISLAMRRLSVVDVETGMQPVHNEDRAIWVIFNGEIYNYSELRSDLVLSGHQFYTDHSDTEVIVHLYEDHGLDFASRINGMFAIALWDSSKQRLLLVRDRMGVKPLYYTVNDSRVIFSSEIKGILAHPNYVKEMDHEGIYHYFTFKHVPAPFTAFKGIKTLRPGEMLIWEDGRISLKNWWQIRFDEQYNRNEGEVQNRILELLDDATRIRMRCDVPFGAYLSGGVDSSSVVALMSRYSDKPVKTFCLGYEDELENKAADLYHARRVAAQYGTDHHEYIMSSGELLEDIDKVISSFDQPFSGTISTFFLSKLISKHVKVALSGDGADELFGSYLTHRTAQPLWHYVRLVEKIRTIGLTADEQALLAPCNLKYLDDLYEISQGNEALWRSKLYLFNDNEKRSILSDDFISQCATASTANVIAGYFTGLTAHNPLNRILEMEWKTQLPDQVLAFVDFLSMAHSVEVRSPFLDYRLVEFAATIPGELKIRQGVVKDVLKRAVRPILPSGIIDRPKEGFVLPIFDWMQKKYRGYCSQILSPERLSAHGCLNIPLVQDLLVRFDSGEKPLNARIWNLMMFQLWWEAYFGEDSIC